MVPKFEGTGAALVYLHVKTDTNRQVAIRYQPRAGNYGVQGWLTGGGNLDSPLLPKFGDEATTRHRLRMTYEAATKQVTGWVDSKLIGTITYELTGRMKFQMFGSSDRPGNKIDLYFDNFALSLGGKRAVAGI